MIAAIAYADKKYQCAEHLLRQSCMRNGVDIFHGYKQDDLPESFRKMYNEKRGDGYWRWKSYIICDALSQLDEDDYLVYLDSGCILTGNIRQLIDCMKRDRQDLMLFSQSEHLIEKYWTKRDVFLALNCDGKPEIIDTPQTYGGYIICRNTKKIRDFMNHYAEVCCTGTLITDAECTMGYPNYSGFIENRHDQSILSVLAKMEGIKPYRDPSQYGENGKYRVEVIERSTFSTVIFSHRLGFVRYFWQLRLVESEFYKEKLPRIPFLYKTVNFIIYKVILRKYM